MDRVLGAGELTQEVGSGNPLRCSAVTMRTAAHRDVGGFDPAFRYVVDWEFWIRVSRKWKVAWLARPTVQVRWHTGSETHRFTAGTGDLDEIGAARGAALCARLEGSPRRRATAARSPAHALAAPF